MNWLPDWQLRLIQLLAVPGLIVAYYLLLFHEGQLVIVCSGGWDDCGAVSGPDAPYSSVGPIPVALIGMAGYGLIFMLVWLRDWLPLLDDTLPEIMVSITGLALLFSLWLTGLELVRSNGFCGLKK
jgi:uncharacterized membrane protein